MGALAWLSAGQKWPGSRKSESRRRDGRRKAGEEETHPVMIPLPAVEPGQILRIAAGTGELMPSSE